MLTGFQTSYFLLIPTNYTNTHNTVIKTTVSFNA